MLKENNNSETIDQVKEILTAVEVARMCRFSRATLSRLVKEGRFPPPVDLGLKHGTWFRADIEAHLERRRRVVGYREGGFEDGKFVVKQEGNKFP